MNVGGLSRWPLRPCAEAKAQARRLGVRSKQPWMLLGPARFLSSEGNKPMSIVWELEQDMPADVWTYSTITTGRG
jgi:hypothetical protein